MAKVLFLGQKGIGERCFDSLVDARGTGIETVGAVSNASEDVWWRSARIRQACAQLGIPFIPSETRAEREIEALISESGADTLLSAQHPWILPARVIEAVGGMAFNLHNAPLPAYKGHNAANHAVLNGERHFAATLHWMTPQPDEGDAAFIEGFEVPANVTAISLYDRAADAGLAAFGRLLSCIADGEEVPRQPIEGEGVFYPRSSTSGLRELDPAGDPELLDRTVRAFYFPPFEPAFFRVGHRKYHVTPAV